MADERPVVCLPRSPQPGGIVVPTPYPVKERGTRPLPPDGAQPGKQIVNLGGLLRQERGLAEADLAIEVGQGTHEGGRVPPFARHLSGEFQRRSEEHTSELQSQSNLVCRLLLEKKNKPKNTANNVSSHS